MEIPAEWLAEISLQNFKPTRPAFRCSAQHTLIAINEIEPMVRTDPLDANGFRRLRMLAILKMIHDDVPCDKPIYIARQSDKQWPYFLRDGMHRFYASRTLGFTHVSADVIPASY
jgi:hypothetical protein